MTVIFLVSGTSWTVPSDWSNTNTIECIGGGGGGSAATSGLSNGPGGGGGEYRKVVNVTGLSGSISISIGTGGSGGRQTALPAVTETTRRSTPVSSSPRVAKAGTPAGRPELADRAALALLILMVARGAAALSMWRLAAAGREALAEPAEPAEPAGRAPRTQTAMLVAPAAGGTAAAAMEAVDRAPILGLEGMAARL
jgi:hypothetical protein